MNKNIEIEIEMFKEPSTSKGKASGDGQWMIAEMRRAMSDEEKCGGRRITGDGRRDTGVKQMSRPFLTGGPS